MHTAPLFPCASLRGDVDPMKARVYIRSMGVVSQMQLQALDLLKLGDHHGDSPPDLTRGVPSNTSAGSPSGPPAPTRLALFENPARKATPHTHDFSDRRRHSIPLSSPHHSEGQSAASGLSSTQAASRTSAGPAASCAVPPPKPQFLSHKTPSALDASPPR